MGTNAIDILNAYRECVTKKKSPYDYNDDCDCDYDPQDNAIEFLDWYMENIFANPEKELLYEKLHNNGKKLTTKDCYRIFLKLKK